MSKKNITINDIAKRANVSKSTVSRVINNSTPVREDKRLAVLEAMESMKFEPNIFARGLAGGQSFTIGVMTQNIGSPFYDAISQGILVSLGKTEYSPIFADGCWSPETGMVAAETLLGRRVDGLIVVGGSVPEDELESLRERVPVLLVGREIQSWGNQCLFVDNEKAGFLATEHLIKLGHRRIVHIAGLREHQDAIKRKSGYVKALAAHGIEQDDALIVEGNFEAETGMRVAETLIENGTEFSAIFAANDMSAMGARLALYRNGIAVPEEVSVIGFDDQAESAFTTPPMTTVKQPATELGTAAAEFMIKLIGGAEYSVPNFETTITMRESTTEKS